MRGWARLAVVGGLMMGLAGCEPGPTGASSPTAANQAASTDLRIQNLAFLHTFITSGERFEVTFDIPAAGSRTVTQYGLKTPQGEQTLDVKPALPIISGGKARMWVGPFTNLSQGGKQAVEFWIIDDQGHPSNRVASELVVQ
ncbi:MAG: hypothetical protein ACK46X_03190 [Candidatus Sericytochromatia bacterium]